MRIIDFTQHIAADIETVWKSLTTESIITEWSGFENITFPMVENQSWEWPMPFAPNANPPSGTILFVDAPNKLSFTLERTICTSECIFALRKSHLTHGQQVNGTDVRFTMNNFDAKGPDRFEWDGYYRHFAQFLGSLAAYLENRSVFKGWAICSGIAFVGGNPGEGVLIADVLKNGPADKAGLKAGDILTHFNGTPLNVIDDFREQMDKHTAGTSVLLKTKEKVLPIILTSFEELQKIKAQGMNMP